MNISINNGSTNDIGLNDPVKRSTRKYHKKLSRSINNISRDDSIESTTKKHKKRKAKPIKTLGIDNLR